MTMMLLILLLLIVSLANGDDPHYRGFFSHDDQITIRTGEPFVVWDTQDTKCNHYKDPLDVPDVPARAFVDDRNLIHLITADTTTWISYGPSLLNTTRNCTIAYNSTFDPHPDMFAADEFLDAPYSFGNGTVISLLHTEYPGNRYNNCLAESYPKCWTVSIGLAISNDWGYTWHHAAPPPNHLVAAVPYRYDPTSTLNAFGWGDTSGIVQNHKDGYYYTAMWNRNPVGLQHRGTCVMRTKALLDPKSWRGWNGTHFSVTLFHSPYDADMPGNEGRHVCHVLDIIPPDCNMLGVTYSVYLEQFVASLWCPFDDKGNMDRKQPFYFSVSPDMVHWRHPLQPLFDPFRGNSTPHLQNAAYPTLLDVSAHSNRGDTNFETILQQATLFYVQITSNFFSYGRQLMGVNVTFGKGTTSG